MLRNSDFDRSRNTCTPDSVSYFRGKLIEAAAHVASAVAVLQTPGENLIQSSSRNYAMLIFVPASALAIGSWLALLLAIGFVLLIHRRAQLEDEFLKQNLPGYNDYAKKVPSRLPSHPTVGRIALKGWVCCRVGGRCAE